MLGCQRTAHEAISWLDGKTYIYIYIYIYSQKGGVARVLASIMADLHSCK
jgi:hypothetical protein